MTGTGTHVPPRLTGAGAGDAQALGVDALAALVQSAPEGIALFDPETMRIQWANEEAVRLLAAPGTGIADTDLHFFEPLRTRGWATVQATHVELECSATTLVGSQMASRAIRFRDVTAVRRRERELRAFSATSASIAFAGPLTTVLDRLAEVVKLASGMFACTFLLIDGTTVIKQAGQSGEYPGVDDYAERLNACTALGAPLIATDAYSRRTPIIVEGWRETTLVDPRFAPIRDINEDACWSSIAVVPLVVRDKIVGVFNGFYLPGRSPQSTDLPFLSAIADLAAVAVDNARLIGESEAKAALEERHRLARELHDSVSQALFSLTLHARAVEVVANSRDPDYPAVARGVADIRELTAGALAEMRALIFQLRPAALHEEGLVAALRKHAAAITARQQLDVRVLGPDDLRLAKTVEAQLFRTCQEALNNVIKHAHANSATVCLSVAGERGRDLEVAVCDDGDGFDPDVGRPGHIGLHSMAERMSGLGGTFEILSAPGRTVVRACIPGIVGGEER